MLAALRTLPRRLLWRARIERWKLGYPDPELRYLGEWCLPDRISIDVGASAGIYTMHLLAHSRAVWAFEPRPNAIDELRRNVAGAPVVIRQCALSDADGERSLVVPVDGGRSTLSDSNPVMGERINVPTCRLDSLAPPPTGFIKIDVEGHEAAVLRGATRTIRRDWPVLLVEIEERHAPGATESVPAVLHEMGYAGWFLRNGRWAAVAEFNAAKHQRVGVVPYINNFVFLPHGRQPAH